MKTALKPAICAAILTLASCSPFQDTYQLDTFTLNSDSDNPARNVRGVAVDAKQRFVWSPTVTARTVRVENGQLVADSEERAIICAEPSPDALTAIAANLDARANASAGDDEGTASVSTSLSETAQYVGQRTQVIQLLRDGLYRACEAYANGALDDFGYSIILGQIDLFMLQLLTADALGSSDQSAADAGKQAKVRVEQGRVTGLSRQLAAQERRLDNLLRRQDNGESVDTSNINALTTDIAAIRGQLDTAQTSLAAAVEAAGTADVGNFDVSELAALNRLIDRSFQASGPNPPGRVMRSACLQWFARNPQVTGAPAPGHGVQLVNTGQPIPAIAAHCNRILHRTVEHPPRQ